MLRVIVFISLTLASGHVAAEQVALKVLKLPFKIAGVGWVDLPMTESGALPTEDRKVRIDIAGPAISRSSDGLGPAVLTWTFGFTNKSMKNIESVQVDEVSPTTIEILRVSDIAPIFHDRTWMTTASPISVTRETMPWLYEDGPSYIVFRFTIRERGKKERVYLQPTAFWLSAKQQLLAQVEKANGG